MTDYRNGNYSAFYVKEPFTDNGNLGVFTAHDFVYYNLLSTWKAMDPSFPFIDSHDKTYNVRDGSDWENTLKPRLHERLRKSKNILLFLSSITKNSQALREEIDYGINTLGHPIIIIYPDFKTKADITDGRNVQVQVRDLWDNLPVFRDNMHKVPTLHVPIDKNLIKLALQDKDLMVQTKAAPTIFWYNL